MIRLILVAALAATAFSPAFSMPVPPDPVIAPQEELVPVALETDMGRIVVAIDKGHAPISAANFLRYVDNKRYDGQSFYRALKMNGGGLIQGGVRTDARKLFPPIEHEPTTKTGLKNVAGAIVLANAGPGTARSDFFILVNDTPSFNAGDPQGDENGFAVFGHVIEGMDVVQKILEAPVDPDKGIAVMKGQILSPEVKILKAARVK